MKEEDFLIQRFGNGNPFRVPEGYFEGLSRQVMSSLPEGEAPAKPGKRPSAVWRVLRPVSVAACVCAVVFGAGMFFKDSAPEAPKAQAQAEMQSPERGYTIDQVAEYAMLDNNDMYYYMAYEQ